MLYVLVVDTTAAMNAATSSGLSYMDCIKLCIEKFVRHSQSQSLRSRMQSISVEEDQYLLVTCGPQPRAQSPLSRLFPNLVRNRLSDAAHLSHTLSAFDFPFDEDESKTSISQDTNSTYGGNDPSRPYGFHPNFTSEEELCITIGWELVDALSADSFLAVTRELQAVNCAPTQTFARAYNIALRLIHRRLSLGGDASSGVFGHYISLNVPVHVVGFTGYVSAGLGSVTPGLLSGPSQSFTSQCHLARPFNVQISDDLKPESEESENRQKSALNSQYFMDTSYLRWNIRMSCVFLNIAPQKNIYVGGVVPQSMITVGSNTCSCGCKGCLCTKLSKGSVKPSKALSHTENASNKVECTCGKPPNHNCNWDVLDICEDARIMPRPLPSAVVSSPQPIPFTPLTELSSTSPLYLWKMLTTILPGLYSSPNVQRFATQSLYNSRGNHQIGSLGDWGIVEALENLLTLIQSGPTNSPSNAVYRKLLELLRHYCSLTSIGGLVGNYIGAQYCQGSQPFLVGSSLIRSQEGSEMSDTDKAGLQFKIDLVSQSIGMMPPLVPAVLRPSVAGVLMRPYETKSFKTQKRRHVVMVPLGEPLGQMTINAMSDSDLGENDAGSHERHANMTEELGPSTSLSDSVPESSTPKDSFEVKNITCVTTDERSFLGLLRSTTGRALTLSSLRQINDIISGLDCGFAFPGALTPGINGTPSSNSRYNHPATFGVVRFIIPIAHGKKDRILRECSVRILSAHVCRSVSSLTKLSSDHLFGSYSSLKDEKSEDGVRLYQGSDPCLERTHAYLLSQYACDSQHPSVYEKNQHPCSRVCRRSLRLIDSLSAYIAKSGGHQCVNSLSRRQSNFFPLLTEDGLAVNTSQWIPTLSMRCGEAGCPRHPLPSHPADVMKQLRGALPQKVPVHPSYELCDIYVPNPSTHPLQFVISISRLALDSLKPRMFDGFVSQASSQLNCIDNFTKRGADIPTHLTHLTALETAASHLVRALQVDEFPIDLSATLNTSALLEQVKSVRLVASPSSVPVPKLSTCFGWIGQSNSLPNQLSFYVAPFNFPLIVVFALVSLGWFARTSMFSDANITDILLNQIMQPSNVPEYCVESVAETLLGLGISEETIVEVRKNAILAETKTEVKSCPSCLNSVHELDFCSQIGGASMCLNEEERVLTNALVYEDKFPPIYPETKQLSVGTLKASTIHFSFFSNIAPNNRRVKSPVLSARISAPASRALTRYVLHALHGLRTDIAVGKGMLTLYPELASSVLATVKTDCEDFKRGNYSSDYSEVSQDTAKRSRSRTSNRLHRRRFLLQTLKQAIPSFDIELALANLAAADELEEDELSRTVDVIENSQGDEGKNSGSEHMLASNGSLPSLLYQTTYHSLRLAELASLPLSRVTRVESAPGQGSVNVPVPVMTSGISSSYAATSQAALAGLRSEGIKPDTTTLENELEALVRFLQPNQRPVVGMASSRSSLLRNSRLMQQQQQRQQLKQQESQKGQQEQGQFQQNMVTTQISPQVPKIASGPQLVFDDLNVYGYLLPTLIDSSQSPKTGGGSQQDILVNNVDPLLPILSASSSASDLFGAAEDGVSFSSEEQSDFTSHQAFETSIQITPSVTSTSSHNFTHAFLPTHVEDSEDLSPATLWQHHLGIRGLQRLRPRAPPIRLLPEYVRFAARQLWNAGGAETPVRSQGLETLSPSARFEAAHLLNAGMSSKTMRFQSKDGSGNMGNTSLLGAGALVHSPYSLLSLKSSTSVNDLSPKQGMGRDMGSMNGHDKAASAGLGVNPSARNESRFDVSSNQWVSDDAASHAATIRSRMRSDFLDESCGHALGMAISPEFGSLFLTNEELIYEQRMAYDQSIRRRIRRHLTSNGEHSEMKHSARLSFTEFCHLQKTSGSRIRKKARFSLRVDSNATKHTSNNVCDLPKRRSRSVSREMKEHDYSEISPSASSKDTQNLSSNNEGFQTVGPSPKRLHRE